jgi:hypothetical protein
VKTTATADHTAEGGDGFVSRKSTVGEQHQRVHGGGRCGEDHAGAQGHGQANPRPQGRCHHFQRRRHHHETPRHRPPRRQDPRRHCQIPRLRGFFFCFYFFF